MSRELDAEVAEKVMGYLEPVTVYRWIDRKKKESPRVMFRVGPRGSWAGYRSYADANGQKLERLHEIKPYSTDVSAAFLVVEKMRELKWCFTLHGYAPTDNKWIAGFWESGTGNYPIEYGPVHSAPEAICRAALAALGGETK